MAYASDTDTETEEMDDGAPYIDMQEITSGDVIYPMIHSNDVEKEQENAELVGEIEQQLNELPPGSSDCIIYRVVAILFNVNPEAYIPRMISIGPFVHNQRHSKPMEAHKLQYFKDFLCRSSPGILKNYIKAVTDLEERVYRCYPGVKIEGKRLAMLMVVDGCFIIELLLKYKSSYFLNNDECKWSQFTLWDLILVENQLPFFVLEELYRVFIGDSHGAADTCTLRDLTCQSLVHYFIQMLIGKIIINSSTGINQTINFFTNSNQMRQEYEPKHLLDLVRQFLIPSSPVLPRQSLQKKNEQKPLVRAVKRLLEVLRLRAAEDNPLIKEYKLVDPMRSATELKNASIKFEKNKNPTSLLDIKFDNAKGVLTIPSIIFHCGTERLLRNLIAYEFYTNDYSYITEYISFLDSLINSTKDVELLNESGIFEAIEQGDEADVAKLFNNLTKNVIVPNSFTAPVRRELLKYYDRPWHKWKANLMHNYFNTPWALMSVVAAIILLILTIIQTTYAGLSFH